MLLNKKVSQEHWSIPFAKSNRFASVSIDTYDRDFRMIERPLSAELEDFRFMSDWNPYFFVGTIALYSIWSIRHRLHLTIQAAVVRHAPELQRKSMYRTKHGWMPIHFIWHSVIGPTTWSVSCCRPAVLLLAVILLLYCQILSFVHCMVTYNK